LVVREVEELDGLLRSSSDLLATPVVADPSFERLAALSTVLTSFYTGLERIFERMAAQLDPVQPEGDHWHIELLSQVARPAENRPAIQERLAPALAAVGQPVLQETPESRSFAQILVEKGAFAPRFLDDARHVAVATLNDVDAVISWNFKHLVNPVRRRAMQAACLLEGHRQIDIVSPFEIADDET